MVGRLGEGRGIIRLRLPPAAVFTFLSFEFKLLSQFGWSSSSSAGSLGTCPAERTASRSSVVVLRAYASEAPSYDCAAGIYAFALVMLTDAPSAVTVLRRLYEYISNIILFGPVEAYRRSMSSPGIFLLRW